MRRLELKAILLCTALVVPNTLWAQDSTASSEDSAAEAEVALLTAEELQTLVGPIALYPDTLLIQILVASTFPLEIIKANNLVTANGGASPEEMKPLVQAEGWDESVAVLAEAFPEVLTDMAENVEWTEAMGTAMLAQSDDVMAAVQDRRIVANDAGILVSGEEQTVEVTQSDGGEETVVIQPTDPEVVYVPQYDSEVVYVQDNNSNDLLTAGLIGFGSIILLDAIFDNNDPWNDYWGCRNCGGWGGGPIYSRPGAGGIDINGDVNIGNGSGNTGVWAPDKSRQKDAQKKITNRRDSDGKTKLPVDKKSKRGDDMRSNLSKKTGASDISKSARPRDAVERSGGAAAGLAAGGVAASGAAKRKSAVDRTGGPASKKGNKAGKAKATNGVKKAAPAKKATGGQKAKAAKRPAQKSNVAQRTKSVKKPATRSAPARSSAMNKRPSSHSVRSSGSRGRASSGGRRGR